MSDKTDLPELCDQHAREARTAFDDILPLPISVNAANIDMLLQVLVFFTLQNEVELCRELARKIQEYWDKS